MNTLTEQDNEICKGDTINEHESATALKEMNNNKSPGSDGLTTEFYKIFWNDLKLFFIKSINFSYVNKSLTELQTQSIITMLPKANKDTSLIDNWRPISLLNTDYKIISKVIANRIKKSITTNN